MSPSSRRVAVRGNAGRVEVFVQIRVSNWMLIDMHYARDGSNNRTASYWGLNVRDTRPSPDVVLHTEWDWGRLPGLLPFIGQPRSLRPWELTKVMAHLLRVKRIRQLLAYWSG